ncbi:MAG: ATP-dependent zinc metalloprotease FtsH, partial [Thermodesulfobacteriota bacterium]
VTIIPRGLALGVTQQIPVEDKYTLSKTYLNNSITVLLGGRAAEEIIFGDQTSGAGNDLERATEIARKMVCEWGMSDKVGPVTFGKREEQIFLGKDLARHKDYSEATALEIDKEIRRIVTENYKRAKAILEENIDLLHKLAEVLLEREVVDGKELDELVKQRRPEYTSLEGSLSAKEAVARRFNVEDS